MSTNTMAKPNKVKSTATHNAGSGAFMFFGFIGALVYLFQQADGFWEFFIAFFQACFWPAFLVYKAFESLYS
jgi:TM2 domain-containing membrane protein YozV